ncbi:hypothetical protein BTH23_01525, partial [Acinetobacter baumannii]
MPNQTFTGSEPTWANACVGENGSPNYIQYSKGYSKAANFLLNNVLNTRGKEVDLYIYPGEFKHEVRQFEKSYDNQQAEQISLM